MSQRVFVYGSLKTGFEHHDRIEGVGRSGTTRVWSHRLVLYKESYPALVPSDPDDQVEGEVFVVTSQHLKRLDRFEDCPELYQRAWLLLEDGTEAWSYVIAKELGATYPTIQGAWKGRHVAASPKGRVS